MCKELRNAKVYFAEPLVTEIRYRPRTKKSEKRRLYYSRKDKLQFEREYQEEQVYEQIHERLESRHRRMEEQEKLIFQTNEAFLHDQMEEERRKKEMGLLNVSDTAIEAEEKDYRFLLEAFHQIVFYYQTEEERRRREEEELQRKKGEEEINMKRRWKLCISSFTLLAGFILLPAAIIANK